MATNHSARRPNTYSILRPRKSRTKNGCLPCRARRKKCDELKPTCGACQRLAVNCNWPEPLPDHTVQEPDRVNIATSLPSGLDMPVPLAQTMSADFRNSSQSRDQVLANVRETKLSAGIREQILRSEGTNAVALFDHYCEKTAPWLVNGTCTDNPALEHVIPLAATDSLVLHTVLALSAVHMDSSTSFPVGSIGSKYYSSALRGLQDRLSDWMLMSTRNYKPILATIILLCHCEFTHGDTFGTALQHLRACREFVEVALDHLQDPDDQDFVVLLVEHYCYFVLIANIRSLPRQDNIRLGTEISTTVLPLIKDLPSFGSIFAYEPEAFSIIPNIANMAFLKQQNLSETEEQSCRDSYITLQGTLTYEQSALLVVEQNDSTDVQLWDEKKQAAINFKLNTLLIFLHASYHKYDQGEVWMLDLLQPLIDRAMNLLTFVEEKEICYGLFWSILVMGSHVRDPSMRGVLLKHLSNNHSGFPFVRRGINLLKWLWEDLRTDSFGLEGLERVASEHGFDLCIT